jgi:hypothetical protein
VREAVKDRTLGLLGQLNQAASSNLQPSQNVQVLRNPLLSRYAGDAGPVSHSVLRVQSHASST